MEHIIQYYILKYVTGELPNTTERATTHSVIISATDAEAAKVLGVKYAEGQRGRFVSVTYYPA